jgi:hypothetical protein
MPTIQVEATLSADKLLEAAAQLNPAELEHFVEQVIKLQERHKASSVSEEETNLLLEINRNSGLPADLRKRYKMLKGKRDDEVLTEDEYRELISLSDQIEQKHVQRLEALVKLAHLRNTTLRELMNNLGIKPPKVA